MSFNIAIDGPAGAGKSTIAKQAAAELGFMYVDTGAMYRTIALYLLRGGIDPENEGQLAKALDQIQIGMRHEDGQQKMILNGEDVTHLIRTQEVGQMASVSSAKAIVREKLLSMQRSIAATTDVIMDGRDIGTRILPKADLKIYLTASVEARAERRLLELREKGENPNPEKVRMDIEQRDYQDTHRKESPLRQAEDAVYLDTSDCTAEEAAQRILELYRERANGSI